MKCRKTKAATAPPAEWPVKTMCVRLSSTVTWRMISSVSHGSNVVAQAKKPLWANISFWHPGNVWTTVSESASRVGQLTKSEAASFWFRLKFTRWSALHDVPRMETKRVFVSSSFHIDVALIVPVIDGVRDITGTRSPPGCMSCL